MPALPPAPQIRLAGMVDVLRAAAAVSAIQNPITIDPCEVNPIPQSGVGHAAGPLIDGLPAPSPPLWGAAWLYANSRPMSMLGLPAGNVRELREIPPVMLVTRLVVGDEN